MPKSKLKISEFFSSDYRNFATYDAHRKIANYVDGNKISMRKILFTIFKNGAKDYQNTDQLTAKVSYETSYKHGPAILNDIAGRLTNEYTGSNNIPLLDAYGNFGSRFAPEMSAPRYTKIRKGKFFDLLYNPIDQIIANRDYKQTFDGKEIEPLVMIPTLPLVLINGADGIANGFAQKILNRNLYDVCKNIKNRLTGKSMDKEILPYYNGFNGKIYKDDGGVVIEGVIKKLPNNKILISEIPIGFSLLQYRTVLTKLTDDGIIKKFSDKSDNGQFYFEVSVSDKFYNDTEIEILKKLKLVKKLVENFTLQDEHGKIIVFNNEMEILDKFINFRLDIYKKRKEYVLKDLNDLIRKFDNIQRFIQEKIERKIIIDKLPKKEIEAILKGRNYEFIDELFELKIYHFTKEKIDELNQKIINLKEQYKIVEVQSIQDMWIQDITNLLKEIKKSS